MSQYATHVLKTLLDKAVSQPDRKRDVLFNRDRFTSKKTDPYPFKRAQDKDDFHACLALAESKGCILLEWEKYYEGTNLQRIRLIDAKKLAVFLNEPYVPELVEQAIKRVEFPQSNHWLYKEVHYIIDAWCSGKMKHNVSYKQPERLNNAIKAILILEKSSELMNYRQFGARYFSDSKIIDKNMKSVIGKLLKTHYEHNDLSYDDILAEFNLVKMRHPFAVSGPIMFGHEETSVSASIRPYIAIPDVLFDSAELINEPDYLLTIENWSSYFEFTEQIHDNAIILFTGGYPSRRLQDFYCYLIKHTSCDLYHWGDSDPHGFQILKVFQSLADKKTVKPHNMEYKIGESFNKDQIKHLKKLIPTNSYVDNILSNYIQSGIGLVEQEYQPASSPLQN
jgi:Wadjet anti plasmid transformation system JetA-like protein